MGAIDLLETARMLIQDPAKWLKGDYSDGVLGRANSQTYSLEGALMEAAGMDKEALLKGVTREFYQSAIALADEVGGKPYETPGELVEAINRIATFNDHIDTRHDDVLAAIAGAKSTLRAIAA